MKHFIRLLNACNWYFGTRDVVFVRGTMRQVPKNTPAKNNENTIDIVWANASVYDPCISRQDK